MDRRLGGSQSWSAVWQRNFFSCVKQINLALEVLYKLIIQTAVFL